MADNMASPFGRGLSRGASFTGNCREVHVLQIAAGLIEIRTGAAVAENKGNSSAVEIAGRDDVVVATHLAELGPVDGLAPEATAQLGHQRVRAAFDHNASRRDDRHALAELGDVLEDVG